MALTNRGTSARLFVTDPGILTEDNPAGSDGITPHPGANQWLGHSAAHHDGQQHLADNANRVSAASLRSISTRTQISPPSPAFPAGAQRSDGSW